MIIDEHFYQTENVPPIKTEQMEFLLKNPPVLCGHETCPTDKETGKYCKCILSVFQHETHYKFYLTLVKEKVESAFVDLIRKDNKKPSK